MKACRNFVINIVVGTIGFVAVIYTLTLAICAVCGIDPAEKLLGALKDVGLVALGALSSILARTGHEASEPTETKIVNTAKEPVPTEPVP